MVEIITKDPTPRPWKVLPGTVTIHGSDGTLVCHVVSAGTISQDIANAAFIVRACNSHEALVEALEMAMNQLIECGDQIHGEVDKNCAHTLRHVHKTLEALAEAAQ